MTTSVISVPVYVPLRDYETMYEVSGNGTIRNIKTKHVLKHSSTTNKYYQVKLSGKPQLLHRILAKHFLWDAYQAEHDDAVFEDLVVDHINGDTTNNKISNLQIITQSENCMKRDIPDYEQAELYDCLPNDSVPVLVYVDKHGYIIKLKDGYYYSFETREFYVARVYKNGNVKYRKLAVNKCNKTTLRLNMIKDNGDNAQVDYFRLVFYQWYLHRFDKFIEVFGE